MHRQDAARVLGVDAGATTTEVDRAFRAAARTAHPDLHPSGSAAQVAAEARMRQLLEARTVLRTRDDAPAGARPRSPHAGWATTTTSTARSTGTSRASAGAPRAATPRAATGRTSRPDARATSASPHPRHAALLSIDAYRRVRSSALVWLALLLGAALACTEAARLDPADGLLTLGATLLAVAAVGSLTMAARAHQQLHSTLARVTA